MSLSKTENLCHPALQLQGPEEAGLEAISLMDPAVPLCFMQEDIRERLRFVQDDLVKV